MMKKRKIIAFVASILAIMLSATAFASGIPPEALPPDATIKSVQITEKLIGDILDEVKAGAGYGQVWYKANNAILNAVNSGQTNGYGYAILLAIARNAIWQCRDEYLRPDFYAENEIKITGLIGEVIAQYRNGIIDYDKACFEAYVKIYQSLNPAFNSDITFEMDICYRDIPAVDNALFAIARRVLLDNSPKE